MTRWLHQALLFCAVLGLAFIATPQADAAVSIISITTVNADSGDTGSTSVDPPDTATAAVAFWNHWDGNARSLTSFTFNSLSFTIHENQASTAGGIVAAGVATLKLDTVASATFAWDWNGVSGAVDQGGDVFLVWISGEHATSFFNDSAVAGATNTTNPGPLTITANATDLVIGMCVNGNAANPDCVPSGGDQTNAGVDNAINGANYTDIAYETTTDNPTTSFSMASPNYASIAAISIIEAAAGGGSNAPRAMHYKKLMSDL